ncbi:MAG: T9SS type A sorting domain-containing protein, partial [bacterium]
EIAIESSKIINRIEIIDNLGQMVYMADNINYKTINISTINWSTGVYYVKIYCDRKVFTEKILIKN